MKAITKLHAFVLKLLLKARSSRSYVKEQSLQNAKLMTILRCYHVTFNVYTLMYNNYVLVRYYVYQKAWFNSKTLQRKRYIFVEVTYY